MKITLKYGIAVTAAIAAWVALKHFVLHLEAARSAPFDLVIFNLAAALGLVLGIRSKRRLNNGTLTFGDGMKTGISIVVAYTILTALYFAFEMLIFGTKYVLEESRTATKPISVVVAQAFGGLIGFFLVLGLIYSLIISAIMKKKLAS